MFLVTPNLLQPQQRYKQVRGTLDFTEIYV